MSMNSINILEPTWRWFGPNDPIKLEYVKQTGATGIVNSLHQIPPGEIWSIDEIMKRKKTMDAKGLRWSVVESIPVHDDIKKGDGKYKLYLENYKQSIRNLGKCGIDIVCYNFMPVIDWARTDFYFKFRDGSLTSKFELKVFAAFDLFVLKRMNTKENYSEEVIKEAEEYFSALNEKQKEKLTEAILLPFPGTEDSLTIEKFRNSLEEYKNIDDDALRENLYHFIKEVVPVAEESRVFLGIHPDDPPIHLLGLSRIVSNKNDIKNLLDAYDSPHNGLTLCTGALGAGYDNDLVDIAESFAPKINFIHLRNVKRKENGDFEEDNHLEGDIDLYAVIKALVLEQQKRITEGRGNTRMPFRPDHGHLMFDDIGTQKYYPGYSLSGRLKGLAEIRGLELGIRRSLGL
jgi:mannonate dehydratase